MLDGQQVIFHLLSVSVYLLLRSVLLSFPQICLGSWNSLSHKRFLCVSCFPCVCRQQNCLEMELRGYKEIDVRKDISCVKKQINEQVPQQQVCHKWISCVRIHLLAVCFCIANHYSVTAFITLSYFPLTPFSFFLDFLFFSSLPQLFFLHSISYSYLLSAASFHFIFLLLFLIYLLSSICFPRTLYFFFFFIGPSSPVLKLHKLLLPFHKSLVSPGSECEKSIW